MAAVNLWLHVEEYPSAAGIVAHAPERIPLWACYKPYLAQQVTTRAPFNWECHTTQESVPKCPSRRQNRQQGTLAHMEYTAEPLQGVPRGVDACLLLEVSDDALFEQGSQLFCNLPPVGCEQAYLCFVLFWMLYAPKGCSLSLASVLYITAQCCIYATFHN